MIHATSPRHPRARGRHRKQVSRRWIPSSNRVSTWALAALLAASAIMINPLVKWAGEAPVPAGDIPAPPKALMARPPTSALSERIPAPPPSRTAVPFATDDRGIVNSTARCDGGQTAVAVGRTEQSFVVICGTPAGRFEYLGVRLRDDAVLRAVAEGTPTNGFLARNSGTVYSVSPTELRVTAGGAVIKREPMLEFRVRSGL